MAAAMTAVVVVAAMTGAVSLQRSYSASEQYATGLADQQHLFPVVNDAALNSTGDAAVYADPAAPTVTTQTIAYRFLNGSITRSDPWQPLVKQGTGYVSSGPVTIAANMDAFPTIAADPTDPTGSILRYNVTFHSEFQPLATANSSNAITLHNVTFVRSKNLSH